MADTTPVLSEVFYYFVVQVYFESRVLCDLLVIFSASSVGAVCGKCSTLSFPRQKSYMVLTRSMATTNDVQEEEALTTALERQLKTLATAVERLTKQNRDLEEQLNQKNAAPNNQGADQEGTSAERRNQEGPQASNAPSKPERQNTSIPSLAEIAPPLVITEM